MTDIDISPEAVERLARSDDDYEIGHVQCLRFAPTLRALSTALAQSRAETAAAYEAAAETYVKGDWDWFSDADDAIRAIIGEVK